MRDTLRPVRSDFGHVVRLAVRWGDMDSLGHVNNAKFFTYDEQTRLEYFQMLDGVLPGMWKSEGLILARLACDFVAQLHYPATLDIAFRITRLGRSSMETQCAMFDSERLVAVSQGVLVWFDYTVQKAAAIPETVRVLIRQREVIAPIES